MRRDWGERVVLDEGVGVCLYVHTLLHHQVDD
jgi:hypothetical protein